MGRCSFCGLKRSEVDALVAGADGAAICTACARLAVSAATETPQPTETVFRNLSRVVTNDDRVGPDCGAIRQAALVVRNDHLAWVGREVDLPVRYHGFAEVDCGGRIAYPGFVDAGTELLGNVGGERPDPDVLIDRTAVEMYRALEHGVTMLDVRAGGSGDATVDTVLLAAARAASELADPLRVGITWVAGRRIDAGYLDGVMAPTVARLASAVEMRCDGSQQAEELNVQLGLLRRLPVRVRLCSDHQRACAGLAGGARTVEADTWQVLPEDTVPVIEPLAVLDGMPLDARSLWEAGGRPAIATRSNPDARAVQGMALAISFAVELGGLTIDQAMWSATRAGALALGDPERGRLRAADPADFVVLAGDEPSVVLARPDANPVWRVVANGRQLPE